MVIKNKLFSSAVILGISFGIDAQAFAQDAATVPGINETAPLSKNGVGPDSSVTGYSESGRGGQGGVGGGATTNGTAAGSGTATGGNPGGYPDRN